jgi:hypothetical protein
VGITEALCRYLERICAANARLFQCWSGVADKAKPFSGQDRQAQAVCIAAKQPFSLTEDTRP